MEAVQCLKPAHNALDEPNVQPGVESDVVCEELSRYSLHQHVASMKCLFDDPRADQQVAADQTESGIPAAAHSAKVNLDAKDQPKQKIWLPLGMKTNIAATVQRKCILRLPVKGRKIREHHRMASRLG